MLRSGGSFLLMKRCRYDVCVLGGGPAGLAAALRAVDFNKKVCIIEKGRIGGADLWNGALQSKTLWEMSKMARLVGGETARRFLDMPEVPKVNHEQLQKTLLHAAEFREQQLLHQLQAADVHLIDGIGSFLNPNQVGVKSIAGGDNTHLIDADYFVIASGSKPREHPTLKQDKEIVLSSENIMTRPIPKSMVIIGAGVIGCEFASIYANFGETEVRVIEKSDRILSTEDQDVAMFVQKLLEKKGVIFHHQSSLKEATVEDGRIKYSLTHNISGEVTDHYVDKALVSIGRVPYYDDLNITSLPEVTLVGGRLKRDEFHRINPYVHIYACGDVTTNIALVNVGEMEGRACVDHMYCSKPEADIVPNFDNLSTIMFLDQEVAAVGLNEQQCQKRCIAYKMARYGYEFVSRAVAMNNTRGFVKLIVTNDRKMQVLGVRAIGPHASSIVELASLAIHNKESAYKLEELLTAYPAVTQGFLECLRMLLGSSVLKPNVFPELVVSEWQPPEFNRGRAYQVKKTRK